MSRWNAKIAMKSPALVILKEPAGLSAVGVHQNNSTISRVIPDSADRRQLIVFQFVSRRRSPLFAQALP